jgi:FkbM family methyltransferase
VRGYQLYYTLLNKLGIRFTIRKLKNGLAIKGYTQCFFMFYEVWSKKDYDIPGFTLTRDMTVIDIGANQGFFTVYAASKGAKVFAFEPCAENFEVLKWNLSKNSLQGSVKIINAAVTGRNGKMNLFVSLDAAGNIMSGTASTHNEDHSGVLMETRPVESVTLDSLFDDLQIQRCDFLKMDCEGAEYEILAKTSRESFSKIARIAVECHENRMQEAITILMDNGFQIVDARWDYLGFLKASNPQLTL